MTSFIFAESQGMESAAASTAALAFDTTGAGGQAAIAKAFPPGLDVQSGLNATAVNTYTGQAAEALAAAGVLQENYGGTISVAAKAYPVTDSLNATGLTPV